MSCIKWTALRDISSGHVAGSVYYLNFQPSEIIQSQSAIGSDNESDGGNPEYVLHLVKKKWRVTTSHVHLSELPVIDELIGSIIGRELLEFDPYGSFAVPDNVLACRVDSDPVLSRVGDSMYYTLSLTLRVK